MNKLLIQELQDVKNFLAKAIKWLLFKWFCLRLQAIERAEQSYLTAGHNATSELLELRQSIANAKANSEQKKAAIREKINQLGGKYARSG